MTAPQHQEMFLGSTANDLFLRPDLRHASRRAQGRSRRAVGHREAARSGLDRTEHGGTLNAGGPLNQPTINGCYGAVQQSTPGSHRRSAPTASGNDR